MPTQSKDDEEAADEGTRVGCDTNEARDHCGALREELNTPYLRRRASSPKRSPQIAAALSCGALADCADCSALWGECEHDDEGAQAVWGGGTGVAADGFRAGEARGHQLWLEPLGRDCERPKGERQPPMGNPMGSRW